MSLERVACGTTLTISYVNSGVAVSSAYAAVYNGAGTLVDSGAMTNSATGLYGYLHTVPSTPGYYVRESLAYIGGKPYKARTAYKAVLIEVD